MFEDFLKNAGDLGLTYLDKKYVNPDENATAKEEQAKKYEQIQQKAAPAPIKSPLDNKILIYGGLGLVGLMTVAIVLKGN